MGMKTYIHIIFVAVLLTFLSSNSYALEGDVAGKVIRLQNSAIAIQDAMPRVLAVGSEILVGDVISTGKKARIEIQMLDESVMTLSERTNFVIVDFIFKPTEGNAAFRLLEGAFKAASGELVKLTGATMTVETRTATIGIRGTEVWGGALADDFEVALLSGKSVYVETRNGRVELNKAGEGTVVNDLNKPPGKPKIWGKPKVERALATVTFD